MEKHLNEKLNKAKMAINLTWRSCFHNKSIAHSSKYKIFEAVAESIMFYAVQTWGSKQYEVVERLLRFYIKRAFYLPANTPNYLIMLETGLSPLFIKTLKLQVDYITRIMNLDESRLPKKAALKPIHTKSGWYKEWIDLASIVGSILIATWEIVDN